MVRFSAPGQISLLCIARGGLWREGPGQRTGSRGRPGGPGCSGKQEGGEPRAAHVPGWLSTLAHRLVWRASWGCSSVVLLHCVEIAMAHWPTSKGPEKVCSNLTCSSVPQTFLTMDVLCGHPRRPFTVPCPSPGRAHFQATGLQGRSQEQVTETCSVQWQYQGGTFF